MKQKLVESIYKVQKKSYRPCQQAWRKVSTTNRLAVRVVVEAHEPSHKGSEALA